MPRKPRPQAASESAAAGEGLKPADPRTSARARTARRKIPPAQDAPGAPPGIWWRTGVIVLATCLTYSNSLSGPFILDDRLSIVENRHIREWWRLGGVLFPQRELPTAGRPLVKLSFAINYALGGLAVPGYHAVNIALHVLCGLLIFGIVRRTLELPGLKGACARRSMNVGLASALFWTLHPLNTEAVDYLTQRTSLMMALCYLLTLYAGIRAWRSSGAQPSTAPSECDGGRKWQAVAVVSCAAGMACKESMVTAPLMIVAYDAIFLFNSLNEAARKRWRFYACLAMSWIVLAMLMSSGPRVHSAGFSSGASPWTYLLDQTVMITRYLRLAVWLRGLVVNYGRLFPASLAVVLPYALFVTSLLALTIVTLIRRPKWGFLGAWFFVTLAPTSSILPIATEVGAERRMYLPLIALVVLAVVAASFVKRVGGAGATVGLVLAAAALSIGTFARNGEYTSTRQLARTVIERYPTSVAHYCLATLLLDSGERDEAMADLRQALPGAPRARYTLGMELLKEDRTEGAIKELQTFLHEQPNLLEAVDARQFLGRGFAKRQRWPDAIVQYRQVLTMNTSVVQRVETQALLGQALLATQNFEEASVSYAAYLRARPNDVEALNNLAICFIATGRLDDAVEAFRRAVHLNPGDGESQRNLANALFDRRNIDEAAVHAQRAVALRPDDPRVHDLLGRVLAVQGRLRDAQKEFERALTINPNDADANKDLKALRSFAAP